MPLPPLATELPPPALATLSRSQPLRTPCGDGAISWRSWGEGEPLVLLHGGSGSWTHWIRNVEVLAASGRRVLAPDLPGFGDSARPPAGQDADAIVEPLAQGLRALAGDAPLDVMGFSFGGLTAALLAAAQPLRVRRLLLVGSPGLGLRSDRLPLVSWRQAGDAVGRDAAHRSNLATLMLHRAESVDDLAAAVQAANLPRDRMHRRRLALTDILVRTLPAITCRIDAIYGDKDALYLNKLPQLAALLRSGPTFHELVLVPDAGHWVQYEAAEAFNREALRLLATAAA
ncbi:alpha/beta fold hydrolase [Ramlibacter sp.]|uniref:alpha/beta fold hydrolase n=1 Tax=Ramlibacter sp. TaxID=1917967 RepID=UPI00260D6DE9|nr:alpha/beta fold hydrolase [Ramlibacter sp.]